MPAPLHAIGWRSCHVNKDLEVLTIPEHEHVAVFLLRISRNEECPKAQSLCKFEEVFEDLERRCPPVSFSILPAMQTKSCLFLGVGGVDLGCRVIILPLIAQSGRHNVARLSRGYLTFMIVTSNISTARQGKLRILYPFLVSFNQLQLLSEHSVSSLTPSRLLPFIHNANQPEHLQSPLID